MPDGANKGSFLQAYNAQIAVDAKAQVIVVARLTQASNDARQLLSLRPVSTLPNAGELEGSAPPRTGPSRRSSVGPCPTDS